MYDPYGVPYPPPDQLAAAMMSAYAAQGMPFDASNWYADPWGAQDAATAPSGYQNDGWWEGAATGANGRDGGRQAARPVGQKLDLASALDSLQTQGAAATSETDPQDLSVDPLWDGPGGAKSAWSSDNRAKGASKGGMKGSIDTPGRSGRPAPGGDEESVKMRRDFAADPRNSSGTPAKAARVAQQLRQLLDFYFEPFNLQHNRYLLDLLARKLGPPAKPGPWQSEALSNFRFNFNDLRGLGRIAAALGKLRPSQWEPGDSGILGNLKHLTWGTRGGHLLLRQPPQVRSFMEAKSCLHPEVVSSTLRYLCSTREHCGLAPAKMVSVLSYSLGDMLSDESPKGQLNHGRLKRQLLLYNSDIICIQGLDPLGTNEGLSQTLIEDGYSYSTAKIEGLEANTIFWDPQRWDLVGRLECGAALAVDLRPREDQSVTLRAICARPEVPMTSSAGLASLFANRQSEDGPVVVGADLSLLGGAEGNSIVEELANMRSVMTEVTGEELAAPMGMTLPEGGMGGVLTGASCLNQLHRPDALLFTGMEPIVALSGHTKRYLQTLDAEELAPQFPAFRIPIVAAFDWHRSTASEGGNQSGWNQPSQEWPESARHDLMEGSHERAGSSSDSSVDGEPLQ